MHVDEKSFGLCLEPKITILGCALKNPMQNVMKH